jgi:RNA polymerase sigma factor (sigma-70 family)
MAAPLADDQPYRCPCCAEKIKADAIVCRFCGAGLSRDHFQPCPHCAEMIRKGAQVCRFCQGKVSAGTSPQAKHGPAPKLPVSPMLELAPKKPNSTNHEVIDALAEVLHGLSQDDPVRSYVNEISHIPMMSEQEEIELARREAMGGEDAAVARRELVQSNLALVAAIAKRYADKGMPLLDLIHEGNLGLIRATERFDQSLGYKFSTYVSLWIHQAITRALADKARVNEEPSSYALGEVVLPEGIWQALATLTPKERSVLSLRFGLDDGRQRSLTEVAELMSVTPDRIRQMEATLLRKLRSARRSKPN